MPRGNKAQTKVLFKGEEEDFIVFVDSAEDLKKWKGDRTIPLAQVIAGFKVFVTHKHGAQGVMDAASKATLENQFGTKNDEDAIIKILEKGEVQETMVSRLFLAV
jgi:ribosome maturation protein Sdo1